jgi:hypothetical protein
MVFAYSNYRDLDVTQNKKAVVMDVFDLIGALIALTALARLISA